MTGAESRHDHDDHHDHHDHRDFTIVNLKRVEDQAPRFGYSPGMESRFARVPLGLAASGLSYFRLAPGFRVPFGHFHTEQEEVYVVVGGSVRARVGHEIVELGPWDALRVSRMVTRNLEGGADGAELIVFGSPSHENRDIEMLTGWWKD
jgi:mannose-6-phosphate isomerase-like protein (cupin superfamily)